MSAFLGVADHARRTVRATVIAAAVGVAGCFTAAFTFAGEPVQAGVVETGAERP
ncbi:MAG: hypothetical protein ACR2FJ_03435 [Qipengyuania sp.]